MVARASACNPQQLERLVSDQLGDRQLESLADHLDQCAECRSQLERLSAGSAWWQDTRAFLSDTALENRSLDSVARHELHFLEPSHEADSLGKLGNYEVRGVLGRGGMGIVLKASEQSLDRLVAIKVLASPFAAQGLARQRFAREAQAAAAVVHPNVMAIHRVEPENDPPYFVMPLVSGTTLQQKLDSEGALEIEELLRVACQVAEGLAAAHAQGLIHRDVKPANILLEPGTDRALLTDFGLARAVDDVSLTCTGLIAGTPQYMSPEQARGESLTHRADLFSLGSVIHAMATGRPPFRADSTYGLLKRIAETPHRVMGESNPRVPPWLQRLVDRLLTKQPKDRYATAAEVAIDLKACLAHVQQPLHCELPTHLRPVSAPLIRRVGIAASIAVIVVLAVGLGFQINRLAANSPRSNTAARQPADTPTVDAAADTVHRPAALVPRPAAETKTPPIWHSPAEQELFQIHLQMVELERDDSF